MQELEFTSPASSITVAVYSVDPRSVYRPSCRHFQQRQDIRTPNAGAIDLGVPSAGLRNRVKPEPLLSRHGPLEQDFGSCQLAVAVSLWRGWSPRGD